MKRTIFVFMLILLTVMPVNAIEYSAPEPPQAAAKYLAEEPETFSEGLWKIIKEAVSHLQPDLAEAARVCSMLVACVLLSSILQGFTGISQHTVTLVTTLSIAVLLMEATNSLIHLGVDTVREISEYGKLLIPVMTSALAAQGGITTSAALYAGTTLFDSVLTTGIAKIFVPMLFVYLMLCISNRALGGDMLKSLQEFVNWLITWGIKTILYVFTGYLSITGVISSAQDAAAIKAAKITITGAVPVVGNIISDASDSILSGIGVVKSSVGIYGLLVILAIWIGPFLKIGVQYLLLKITAAVCSTIGSKQSVGLIKDISTIMGFLLAIIGTVCLLMLVSIVCFLKGAM